MEGNVPRFLCIIKTSEARGAFRVKNNKKMYYSKFESLPELLKEHVATMPAAAQELFMERYNSGAKSLKITYLSMVVGVHYGYLGRWDDQLFFYLTLGGVGFWWVSDLFRIRGMVGHYNTTLARNILKDIGD